MCIKTECIKPAIGVNSSGGNSGMLWIIVMDYGAVSGAARNISQNTDSVSPMNTMLYSFHLGGPDEIPRVHGLLKTRLAWRVAS